MKAIILPNDPLISYVKKGELKDRYFNPQNIFKEITFITFTDKEASIDEIKNTTADAKVNIITLPPLSNKDIFSNKKLNQLLKITKDIKADVVRSYNPTLTGYFGVKIAQNKNIKSVVSIHNMFGEIRKYIKYKKDFLRAIKYNLLLFKEKYVYKNSDKIIGVTSACFDSIDKKYLNKTEVIFNRVYKNDFYPIDIKKEYDIIMVGRLEKPKRQDMILKSIKELNLKVLFIGDGAEFDNLKKYSNENNLDVTFIKSVKNNELVNFYNKAKINIQITDYEGFGIPLLEAMACGLDVMCSDILPFREFAKNVPIFVNNEKELFEKLKKYQFKGINQKALKRFYEIEGSVMEEKETLMYKRLING